MSSDAAWSLRPPVVSVIMANHNGSAYLADAIASVRQQSLRELELIVSDDASSDDSISIVEKAIVGDPQFASYEARKTAARPEPETGRSRSPKAIGSPSWTAMI